MPLGIERINPRRRPPNERITFVKALDGPEVAVAQDFLERVAAIVFPIMRDNHLSVMSLEEFPPNMEFWGRNFNAGECIQLVLRHPKTHLWLPFEFVQGVMIHELAHIHQMNHSRAFWSLRNKYATALSALHARGYTGEGFFSAGRTLLSSVYTATRPLAESDLPETICGGTYRSRGTRRRRRGQPSTDEPRKKISYAERQLRIKERKFGPGEGNKVGAEEETRVELEGGKALKGKPRVAKSVRGRELRAAAALKRFEQQKTKEEEEEETGDEEEDDEEEEEDDDGKAVDVGGGRRMVPVSKEEDEGGDEEEMGKEMLQLLGGCGTGGYGSRAGIDDEKKLVGESSRGSGVGENEIIDLISSDEDEDAVPIKKKPFIPKAEEKQPTNPTIKNPPKPPSIPTTINRHLSSACPACSTLNPPASIRCEMCGNVLDLTKMPAAWKCRSPACRDVQGYFNPPDAGACGVCGQRKPKL
ncbi:hypothetical protein RUND412_004866 [Rhizina undulata]